MPSKLPPLLSAIWMPAAFACEARSSTWAGIGGVGLYSSWSASLVPAAMPAPHWLAPGPGFEL